MLHCSCSAIGDFERCHKVTVRTRTKVSNRQLDSTTEAYCKRAESESNKRYKEPAIPLVLRLQAFRSRLCKLRKNWEKRALAVQAILEARRIGEAAEEYEYDEQIELNLLLDEVCDEMCCEFQGTDEELCWASGFLKSTTLAYMLQVSCNPLQSSFFSEDFADYSNPQEVFCNMTTFQIINDLWGLKLMWMFML